MVDHFVRKTVICLQDLAEATEQNQSLREQLEEVGGSKLKAEESLENRNEKLIKELASAQLELESVKVCVAVTENMTLKGHHTVKQTYAKRELELLVTVKFCLILIVYGVFVEPSTN